MNASQLKELIENKSVSDEDVTNALREYMADRYDEGGVLRPINEVELKEVGDLGVLTKRLRPRVMEKLRKNFLFRTQRILSGVSEIKGKLK